MAGGHDSHMDVEKLSASATHDSEPPGTLSPECKALWYSKAGQWEEAHNVAQDIDTSLGSWIHAHLHLIEGDIGNARYWYTRAGKTPSTRERIDEEWHELAHAALAESG